MQIKVNTQKFQEMLSKAIKGAGNNKLIPLTSLISIAIADGKMTLTTTDATNYLYVSTDVDAEDFYAVVTADTLYKLVARMSCDTVTLTMMDSYVEVRGNGKYKLDVPLEDDGRPVRYPNPLTMMAKVNKVGKLSVVDVKRILSCLKPALATTLEYPCYTAYYTGESVIATDTWVVSSLPLPVFDSPKLIPAEMMSLLDVVTDEFVDIYSDGKKLLFESENYALYGYEGSGIEDYSIDALNTLLTNPFVSHCSVSKAAFVSMLDRLSLFTTDAVTLTFSASELHVSSDSSTGSEAIECIESNVAGDDVFTCSVSFTMLMSQLKAHKCDTVDVWFGDQSVLKLTDSEFTTVIALIV